MKPLYAVAAVALAAVIGGVFWLSQPDSDDQFAQCRAGQVGGGAIGGAFELVNGAGETVTDQDIITGPTLLYFGYTFCPDVCPLDNARNIAAIEILESRGREITPVFISVDPERDTPEQVAAFAENFHPRMIGLTGSPAQVKAASNAYRTYFAKQEEGDPDYYLIDHSTFSYLVFPDHGFVDFFRRDETPEQMATRLECFLDAAG